MPHAIGVFNQTYTRSDARKWIGLGAKSTQSHPDHIQGVPSFFSDLTRLSCVAPRH